MTTDYESYLISEIMLRHSYQVDVIRYNAMQEAQLEQWVKDAEAELEAYRHWIDGVVKLCLTGR
jgi:hypothetical protein